MMGWIHSLFNIVAKISATDWLILVGGLAIFVYWLGSRNYGHFAQQGLPCDRPLPFLGNMISLVLGRISLPDYILDLYKRYANQQFVCFYQFLRPTVIICDPELIKLVTVKEFDHFTDHQPFASEKIDPVLTRSLFSLNGQEWRDMRVTLSPAFTASKMRNIFQLIDLCGEQMVEFLERKIKNSPRGVYEVEMKDFSTRFANDVIATSAFGIECDSLGAPDNEFYRMGRELTKTTGIKNIIFFGYSLSPKLMEVLGISLNSPKVRNFFHNIVHETIKERQQKGIQRPDMLQLLMQAREGKLKAEAGDEQESVQGARAMKLTDIDITAQAVIFFFAGFDTVSAAISFCAYALATKCEVQDRLHKEVDDVFNRYGGKLTYEAVQDLKYTEMFINEVLRFYSPVPVLDRICTKDFTIPAQGVTSAYTVRKGDTVWIPVYPIHRDGQYWDYPDIFDPERFCEEKKHKIKPFAFMPFGLGPRICIASRFALLEIKVALAHILRRRKFVEIEKTPKKVDYLPNDFSGNIKGGFWVGIASRLQQSS